MGKNTHAVKVPQDTRWLNEREAAAYLGMSPLTLYRRRKSARSVPHVREGGRVMYDRDQLDEYMRAHAVK